MTVDRLFTRRRFLAGAGATGAALAGGALLGRYLGGGAPSPAASSAPAAPLVLVTLYGGNDGLNTVVPSADPAYASARPTLGYHPSEVLDLGDGLGLNPRLKGFHDLWQSGRLAVVRGVGYPDPNLSHFASMAIWQTGDVTGVGSTGWLGRWLDRTEADPMTALSIGATLPPVLRGEQRSATAVTAPEITIPGGPAMEEAFAALQEPAADRSALAAAVAGTGADLLAARADLDRLDLRTDQASASTGLGAQLGLVAQLIRAGAPTRVYQVSLSSFDTHAAEKANHERLLEELDGAVTAFMQGVAGHPAVLMTYSEFGRRPAENASGGTDHGTASPLFVLGTGVRGGRFYGEQPSLTSLDPSGNLRYTVDFRSVYATVLERVLGSDPEPVLGGSFPTLPFV